MKNEIKYQENNTRYYGLKIVIETGTNLFKRAKKLWEKQKIITNIEKYLENL